MNQQIIDTAYVVLGIGIMSVVVLIGIVGIVKILRETNKIKDTKD
jgi:hypothetical protein